MRSKFGILEIFCNNTKKRIFYQIVIHINFDVNLIDSENCPFFKKIFVVQVYKFGLVCISFWRIDTRWKPINQWCGKNLKDQNALVVDDKQKVETWPKSS